MTVINVIGFENIEPTVLLHCIVIVVTGEAQFEALNFIRFGEGILLLANVLLLWISSCHVSVDEFVVSGVLFVSLVG